jgi:sugar-specific transcriptional regulator TrmB
MKTKDKLIKLLQKHGQMTVHDMSMILKVSRQYIHRVLSELENNGLVIKTGIAPKVYYTIAVNINTAQEEIISYEKERFLNEHFLLIDALGNIREGLNGMKYWCEKQNLQLSKTIDEYILTRQKYLAYANTNGLISGLDKLKSTKGIDKIGVDALYYLDFYAIERFGKTRLGTLMHYAKQGQNKMLMKQIVSEIKQRILYLIHEHKIDAIAYVPPTINRKIQIMTELKKLLDIQLPQVKIEKIKTAIIIPQKALSKIYERVANAQNTFAIPSQQKHQHLLIIDDAVGSGATINEIALKIKAKGLAKEITGLAISGSYKGFDVISEL